MHRYHWDAQLEPRLEQAARRVQRLRQARLHPAAVQSLKHWFRIHHTYHSNAIEGNRLTLPETRAVIEHGITIAGKPLKDHLEAVNLAQALDFIESLAKTDTPLDEREVRDIHAIVLRTIEPTEAGAYRRINVRIGGSEHVPPEALHVPERMREFGAWLSSQKPEDPVVMAAIAHTWFETIHPFIDGNGRTGRLLANLLLMRHGYPVTVLRVEERARYYAALDQSHKGDLTPMVELTLDCVEQSLTEYERATHEVEVQEPAIEYLAERLGAPDQNTGSREFLLWKYSVEALLDTLEGTARRITERLPSSESRVALEVRRDTPITQALWKRSKASLDFFATLIGHSPHGDVFAPLQTLPLGESHSWLRTQPGLLITVDNETLDEPERLLAVTPEEHQYTAIYAAGEGRAEFIAGQGVEHLNRELHGQHSEAPAAFRIEHGVSAQKIATDIWTFLIERYLTGSHP